MIHWDVDPVRQAEMLGNRLRKNMRRLRSHFRRRQVDAFRLYDRDIPEIRLAIDYYAGHLVVAEYERRQHSAVLGWAEQMASAAGDALSIPGSHVHLKVRRTRPGQGLRYQRLGQDGERIAVREGDLRFLVNLVDYLDTGLFLDHRETRQRVLAEASGRRVLNLYCYTGSFTCAALAGGASSVVSVDRSQRYLDWARDNLALNQLTGDTSFVASDARAALRDLFNRRRRFDLIILDPPSFSTPGQDPALDVARDHPQLLRDCMRVLAPGGSLWFSTNHQRFVPRFEGLPASQVEELTSQTVPLDFRNRTAHRCFRFVLP